MGSWQTNGETEALARVNPVYLIVNLRILAKKFFSETVFRQFMSAGVESHIIHCIPRQLTTTESGSNFAVFMSGTVKYPTMVVIFL
jgi:hypothetical protein